MFLDLLDTLILPFFGPLHTLIECYTLGAASSLCLHHVCFELPSLYPTTCDLVVVLRLVWRKAWWLNHIAVLWMAYCFVSLQMGWCMFSFFVVLLGSCSVEQIGNGSLARYSCHRSCVHFCVTMGVHFQLPCPLIGEAHQARTVGKFTQRRFNQARATERPTIWNGKQLDFWYLHTPCLGEGGTIVGVSVCGVTWHVCLGHLGWKLWDIPPRVLSPKSQLDINGAMVC